MMTKNSSEIIRPRADVPECWRNSEARVWKMQS